MYGGVLAAKSDANGAVREFDRALQIDPANTQALGGRLSVDLQRKRPDDGRARIARAIAAQPKNTDVLILAGRFEMQAGDLPAAERQLRRVLEVNPAAFDAYALLGQIFIRQQRLDDARKEFEKLASLSAEQVGPKTMVGMIYDIQNKPQDARRAYEEVVKATTRAPVAANNLAWNYAEAGENLDVALQLAQSAKQQLPDSHEIDDTLGWVYVKRNSPELAIPPLERATRAAPGNAEYQYHLGMAYHLAQRSSDARAALKRALELRADFTGAKEARATLASLQ
jgi:Flp pilus assembly protein TadD